MAGNKPKTDMMNLQYATHHNARAAEGIVAYSTFREHRCAGRGYR